MAVLNIKNLEVNSEDAVLFPAFNSIVSEKEVVAIYSSLNVRTILLQMLIAKVSIPNGEINVNGELVSHNNPAYFSEVGIFFLDDGIYERLSVKDQFKFYKGLYGSVQSVDDLLRFTQLESKGNTRIRNLSPSEKRRIQYARILFQNPALFVFEEPVLNVDVETKYVFIKLINHLKLKGKSIVVFTGNMENAITMTNDVYRLDEAGLHRVAVDTEEENVTQETELTEDNVVQPIRFDKIPTKVNDKMVLFDPPEIDYIESNEGQSNIHIKGEVFSGVFTLTELEKRLQPYGFFRCHRSYIVNLQKVREIITWTRNSYSLILDDQSKSSIPLSKTKMAELKEMLGMK